jgi:hypothetical protein
MSVLKTGFKAAVRYFWMRCVGVWKRDAMLNLGDVYWKLGSFFGGLVAVDDASHPRHD